MLKFIAAVTVGIAITSSTATAGGGNGPSLALATSNTIVATWRCQDQLRQPRTRLAESPWEMGYHSYGYRQMVYLKWLKLRSACLQVLHEMARQWNWQAWLPDKWRRIGICETSLNWRHHNGKYVSAFGISRQAYDQDADVFGVPHWDDRRIPSPWQQYQAALGHYKIHNGFSGWGCRGA